MEIERKYQINQIPADLSKYEFKEIEQGYLCHNPTIRIRKSNNDFILTYKSKIGIEETKKGSPVINQEVELLLTQEAYQTLKAKIDGNMIYKTRYILPIENGLIAELDIFKGLLSGLVIVEVEFPDLKTSMNFMPPVWFGKELSDNKQVSNYHLSKLSSCSELVI